MLSAAVVNLSRQEYGVSAESEDIGGSLVWKFWRAAGYLLVALNIGLFILFCTRGLDLTDEGFYLNWIKNPWEYSFFLTATGFFFHPLALIFPDNVVAWRWAGGALLLGSAFAFGCSIRSYVYRWLPEKPELPLSTILVLSTTVLFFYSWWLPSPGYNLLNLAGCLLFAAGLLFSAAFEDSGVAIYWRLARSAGLTTFGAVAIWMSRPSTVFPMALFALIFLAVHRRRGVLWSLILAGVLTLALSALIVLEIGGTFQGLIERYQQGFAIISLLRPDLLPSIQEQFQHTFSRSEWGLFLGASLLSFVIVQTATRKNNDRVRAHLVVLGLLVLMSGGVGFQLLVDSGGQSVAKLISLGTVLALLAAYLLQRKMPAIIASSLVVVVMGLLAWGLSSILAIVLLVSFLLVLIGWFDTDRAKAAWTAMLLCWIPIFFGIGSSNDIDLMAGLTAVFWISTALFLVVVLFPTAQFSLTTWISVGFSCATVVALVVASFKPYRLVHSLWAQNECVAIGESTLPICLDRASVAYFRGTKGAAYAAGFTKGTPVIDLTGTSPSTIFFLEGLPIGSAWLLGGYPKSEEFTRRALETVPRDQLGRAWVLTAPKGHQSIPDTVMKSLGLNFPLDYQEVVRSGTEYENETHVLWKPNLK
ncbi:hypothetical protein [Nitrobacter sp.]|uniref:hypothetical protein n=1 Tax=Nitrobacter sp. TaxID=29420 RepID=UPI00399D6B28